MPCRVILADDHAIVRDGLRSLLQSMDGIDIVGEAGDGSEAVELVDSQRPDVVIMDVSMPGMNGIEATRTILSRHGDCKIVALSMHSNKSFVLEMLRAGASAYLLKNSAFKELSRALEYINRGQPYISPEISTVVLEGLAGDIALAGEQEAHPLSPREQEVLSLLAEGHSNRGISDKLHLSIKTIQTHRRNILDKLGLESDADLVKYAIRKGLVSSDI